MIYLGIDPGKSGGIAVILPDGKVLTQRMLPTERDIWDYLHQYRYRMGYLVTAVIEKVWGHIGVNQPGSAMFNFGWSYGGLRMALVGNQIPFDEVVPKTWQKAIGIPPRDSDRESKKDHKHKLKAKAQQLFPKVKVTLETADSLLIAEYCRRKQEGRL